VADGTSISARWIAVEVRCNFVRELGRIVSKIEVVEAVDKDGNTGAGASGQKPLEQDALLTRIVEAAPEVVNRNALPMRLPQQVLKERWHRFIIGNSVPKNR